MISHIVICILIAAFAFGLENKEHTEASAVQSLFLKDSTEGVQHLLLQQAPPRTSNVLRANKAPKLIFSHFAKCGGTFVKNVMRASVPDVSINNEWEPLQKALKNIGQQAKFKIALMRNPFNYLVSLWSMFSSGRGELFFSVDKKTQSRFKRQASFLGKILGNSIDDRKSFSDWVRHFSTTDVGLVSSRFSAKYLESGVDPLSLQATPGNSRNHFVTKQLKQLDKDAIADCWVYTEQLAADLENCLLRFEGMGGCVDWQAFNKSIGLADHNAIPHVSCAELFSDPKLSSYVAKNEKMLSNKFGYTLGCS